MRERIAMGVCLLAVGVVVALSLLFASAHNPRVEERPAVPVIPAVPAVAEVPTRVEPTVPTNDSAGPALANGRAVYAALNCSACHSIAGDGNPRYPLDGVGSHLNAVELRAWIIGTGVAADTLPPGIIRRKQRYRAAPESDLNALIDYLSTLTATK